MQAAKSSIGDLEKFIPISVSHRAVIDSLRIEPSIDQVARKAAELADCCWKSPGRSRFGSVVGLVVERA